MNRYYAYEELKILLENKKILSLDARSVDYGDDKRIDILRTFLDSLNDESQYVDNINLKGQEF